MKLRKEEKKTAEPKKDRGTGKVRFQIVKLEERIAPTCHYNPQGKLVGCGHHHHGYY